ncbi:MAG: sensory box histidine kinase/response regulator [Acidimicrobiales bacterium]|nr:sensory box histidine kinase/response regulator [Acidimicrobiales bacterium]
MNGRRRLIAAGVATALFGAVPIAALGLSVTNVAQRSVRNEVHARMRTTAEASGQILDDAFSQGVASVQTAAGRPALVEDVRADLAGGHVDLVGQLQAITANPSIVAAFITTLDGRALAAAPQGSVTAEQMRSWAVATRRSGPTTVSDAFDPGGDRGVAVAGTSPIAAAGEPVGVLGIVFDVRAVQNYAESIAKAQHVQLSVVDRSGTLLSTPAGVARGIHRLGGSIGAGLASGDDGLGSRTVNGTKLLSAYAAIPSLGWRVLAETPEHPALAGARDIRSTVLLVVAVLLLGLLAVVAVVVRAEQRRLRAERGWHEAHDDAVEASRMKSEFLANMSHEIRTPLNGVLGMTSLLLDSNLDADQRDMAETSHRSGEALLTIINDILDFSRIEAGKLEVETVEFDLRGLVEDISRLLAATADTKGLELFCAVDADIPARVLGDPTRIRQILSNLAGNAVKFTDHGEVVIRVSAEEIADGTLRARLAVSDTGIGVSEDAQPHLFEAFTQADSSTTRRFGGSGLGLTISQRLVELMDGEIGFTSEAGAGSTFWFTVPLAVGDVVADDGPGPRPVTAGTRVLVVDDNEVGRTLLQRMLAAWGMDVTLAADGTDALATLQVMADANRPPELVLLDLNMPELDGLGVTRAIRATYGASPRIVLLTSSAQQGDARLGREAGIDGYLAKPIRRDDLSQVMKLVMAGDERPAELVTRHVVREQRARLQTRVLLAEDNPVNQKVAVLTLEALGYHVDVASDGEQAVAAVERNRYDAILMDCQMPVLDGFEATRRIRSAEPVGQRIPIIALTSSATAADRQLCLDAGMDDHIAKPLHADALQEVLTRMTAPDPSPESANDAFDTLASAAGPDVLIDLIDTFADDSQRQLDELQQALLSGDLAAVAAAAHRIRGAAGVFGATELSATCTTIEGAAHAGQHEVAKTAIERLAVALPEAITDLRNRTERFQQRA